jgi:DNA-binding HxlR family transcriptional regulator
MTETTGELIGRFRQAWRRGLEPGALSIVKLSFAFLETDLSARKVVARPRSFSQLQGLCGMSSRTLAKWLKDAEKRGLISKTKQPAFPFTTAYVLTVPPEVQTLMRTLYAFEKSFETLIEGAAKGALYAPASKIVEKALRLSNTFDLWIRMDPSWLQGPTGELTRIFFNALALVTFWGTFYTLRALPQKEAEAVLNEKGLLRPGKAPLLEAPP